MEIQEEAKRKLGFGISRSWDFDTNDEKSKYHNVDFDEWKKGITEEWSELAQREKSPVEWLHFIFHDRDAFLNKDSGKVETKLPHAHAVVKFSNARTQNAVMKEWCGNNTRVDNCYFIEASKGGYRSALLYMTHHSTSAYSKEKTWYPHQEVISFNNHPITDNRYLHLIKADEDKKTHWKDAEGTAIEFVEKIIKGEMTETQALKQLQEDHNGYATNKYKAEFEKATATFRKLKIAELTDRNLKGTWKRTTTYLSGQGQEGKTRTAIYMADKTANAFGVHIVAGGGGRNLTTDIVDGYENENSAVLDDIDSSEFNYRDFFKMFDRTNWSLSKSRNVNKPWFPEDVFITNDTELGVFFKTMIYYSKKSFQKQTPLGASETKKIELNGNTETLEACRMTTRRVQQYVKFRNNSAYLFKLVDEIPPVDEIRTFIKEKNNGVYDERIFDLFYYCIGRVDYTPGYSSRDQFENERRRIAEVAYQAFNGAEDIEGFTKKEKFFFDIAEDAEIEKNEEPEETEDLQEDIRNYQNEISRLKVYESHFENYKNVVGSILKMDVADLNVMSLFDNNIVNELNERLRIIESTFEPFDDKNDFV